MRTYPWSCLGCEATNSASATACGRCGCPARATRAQVEAARDAYRRSAGLPPLQATDAMTWLQGLPLLLIAAGALLLLGGLALIVGSNVSVTAFGGLMIALAALCVSSYRRPPG